MIIPPPIARAYALAAPYVEEISRRVRQTLSGHCWDHGYAFMPRTKTAESLAEKIESGRFMRWPDLDDLFGCSIVIPTLEEEPSVLDFLQRTYEQRSLKKRDTSRKPPDCFRFDSTRFVGRLRPPPVMDVPQVYGINFEVQVRTAFEHAWCATTHALAYKNPEVKWERQRLAAQLKASVEQLDLLILGFEGACSKIYPSDWPEITAKSQIAGFMQKCVVEGLVPEELGAKDWSRFADNVYSLLRASPASRRKRPEDLAKEFESTLTSSLKATTPPTFPRSISLFQFAFAALDAADIIMPPLQDYYALITPELELVFPKTKRHVSRFSL